jgi:hypothetical protein
MTSSTSRKRRRPAAPPAGPQAATDGPGPDWGVLMNVALFVHELATEPAFYGSQTERAAMRITTTVLWRLYLHHRPVIDDPQTPRPSSSL